MPIYDLSSDFDLLRRNLTLVAALARAPHHNGRLPLNIAPPLRGVISPTTSAL